ncbi:phosphotransferase family protein [Kitasatospora sp. NPDC096147]|uniref:phosphotransferase family protein n=1 Tax=Kitasatospora sp. NPDC096147 TaxID=3364093 RepID=UPI0037F56BF1
MTVDQLAGVAAAVFGPHGRLIGVSRLRGGSKKGVYRLHREDGGTAIAYLWDDAESYWPAAAVEEDHADPFSHASGIDLFLAAHHRLTALDVRVPRLLLADRSRTLHPAELVVVEDVPGEHLGALLDRDPAAARPVLARLAGTLALMRRQSAPAFGKVALVDGGGSSRGTSCERTVLDRALADLAEAATRDERMAAVRDRVAARLHDLAGRVRPRAEHVLVHGELGPDHVLVDGRGEPVLIDIEGLMYFDAEWEHVFLRLRFDEHYHHLRVDGLDQRRLALYALAMSLSLVAGPLRLLDGDFPDRAFMLGIVEHNLSEVLAALG